MEIYFDNAATTKVDKSVCELVAKVMTEDYGNPSSLHMAGVRAENYIKTAKEIFAKILKCDVKEIFFTSGGTESNNTALIGAAFANKRRGNHIISSNIEHASVYNPILELRELGFEVDFAPVDEHGVLKLDELKKMLREDTILVSLMSVNNEIGTIQPIEEAGKIIKAFNKDIVYHVDHIQGFGKMKLIPKKCNIDLLSVSGHKFHGPKGTGILYVKERTKIKPLILGGGQQKNMRSGTENVPGIAGIGLAADLAYKNFDARVQHMYDLREYLIESLKGIEDVHVNGFTEKDELIKSAPHVVSISVGGVRAEVLLHSLEDKGIYVSSGSACSSNHPAISGTLKAIGLTSKYTGSTIRVSFCFENTKEEVDELVKNLKEMIPILRKYKAG